MNTEVFCEVARTVVRYSKQVILAMELAIRVVRLIISVLEEAQTDDCPEDKLRVAE